MTKKNKDTEDIKKNLKSMNWDDLSNNLIDLEREYEENKSRLKKDQKIAFNLLILLYEEEKLCRIGKNFDHSRFIYDTQYVGYDWTDDSLDDY